MPHFLQPLLRDPAAPWALVVDRTRATLASTVEAAFDSASRRRGLLGRHDLARGVAMVIAPSNAVHTCFMRFPIDIVFVARDGAVLKVKPDVKPWRLAMAARGFAVVELRAGSARDAGIRCGDRLALDTVAR